MSTVIITNEAADFIKSSCDKNNSLGMRLSVKSSGCNGFKYSWELTSDKLSEDEIIEANGVFLAIDSLTAEMLQNSTIELEKDLFSSTLKINNPQVGYTCGCGQSFSIGS
jgi:iron-sulfur cluster assembly protein